MIDNFYETTDYTSFIPNDSQKMALKKNIQFVKGSDYYKGVYNKNDVKDIVIRYYQIALFEENNKKAIRSYLFQGQSSKGACFFDYKIIKIKDYFISDNKFDKFLKFLKKMSDVKNQDYKIMFKYYPVYNFKYTSPPTGNELSQCYSELLK